MAGPDPDASWRRLSARMLLVYPVRELARLIPALVGLVFAGRAVGGGEHSWWLAVLGVVGVIVFSLLRWATTRYRITPEQVQLRTGLFERKTTVAPADRVRSVDVTASALHRILGLAKVDIGTGIHEMGSGLSLDSLPAGQAAALRAELLHRSAVASSGTPPVAASGAVSEGEPAAPADHETELVRLDPRWVRFAPFTMSGVLAAVGIFGVGWNLLSQIGIEPDEVGVFQGGLDYLVRTPIWLDVLAGSVALLALVTMLAIGGYVLSYWGFRLTRHTGGTLHIARGLLTTRATSIEEVRLRGVELAEPLLLRAVHAARLSGITTGLKSGGADGGSSLLLPPAPIAVARDVATAILRDPGPVAVVLTAHGPAARKRSYVQALMAVLDVAVTAGVIIWLGVPVWLVLPAVVVLPNAVLLAEDRYRSLGHAIAGSFLVTRAGSLTRRRDVIACDGIIGWNVGQTFFQRRVRLATLTATTAAGRQQYAVKDVPLPMALALADRALPGLLTDFLQPTSQTDKPTDQPTDKPRDNAGPKPTNLGTVHDKSPQT